MTVSRVATAIAGTVYVLGFGLLFHNGLTPGAHWLFAASLVWAVGAVAARANEIKDNDEQQDYCGSCQDSAGTGCCG